MSSRLLGDDDLATVARALAIAPSASAAERTIEITTTGARTGLPRRVEVWLHHLDARWYLTGMPVPRSWYANLRAHPRFVVHLKHRVTADLAATAEPVGAARRRRVITAILELQQRPGITTRVTARQNLDDWLARSPLVEVVFDDQRLQDRAAASRSATRCARSRCGLENMFQRPPALNTEA